MAELLRGARTGEAVYTTLRWGAGPPASWPLHLARLSSGAAALGMPDPSEDALLGAAEAACAASGLDASELRLRITIVADDRAPLGHLRQAPPGCAVFAEVAGAAPDWATAPAAQELWWAGAGRDPTRPLAGHKLAALADDLHWRRRAQAAGMDDALLGCVLPGGARLVSEATTAALLVLDAEGRWLTPAPNAGQVRSTTLQALRQSGLPVVDVELRWETLQTARLQGVWTLSALSGARPVKRLGEVDVSLVASDLQARLADWLRPPARR